MTISYVSNENLLASKPGILLSLEYTSTRTVLVMYSGQIRLIQTSTNPLSSLVVYLSASNPTVQGESEREQIA